MEIQSNHTIIDGITGYVSTPTKYTMHYLNGSYDYEEKFAVITLSSKYTGNASKSIDDIIESASTALAAAVGSATGGLGLALKPLAKIALQWIKGMIFNDDGSITLYLANHYIGTKKSPALDPTFFPGGLDPVVWTGIVNSVKAAISAVKISLDGAESLSISNECSTSGEQFNLVVDTPLERIKNYLSKQQESLAASAASGFHIPKEQFYYFGLPTLADDTSMQTFFSAESVKMNAMTTANEISTYSLSCFACKTAAYATAGLVIALGAAGVAQLSVGSSIVVALASALGISVSVALGAIQAAVAFVTYEVSVVASEICSYVGYC